MMDIVSNIRWVFVFEDDVNLYSETCSENGRHLKANVSHLRYQERLMVIQDVSADLLLLGSMNRRAWGVFYYCVFDTLLTRFLITAKVL